MSNLIGHFNSFSVNFTLDKIEIKEDFLNAICDYMKDEIEIRVESAKTQVEEIGNRFKEKVDKLRNDYSK